MTINHTEMLDTLEKKLAPEHTALVVIDMQNDFCADEGAMAEEGFDVSAAQEIGPRIGQLLSAARDAGAVVVFVRNVYNTDANHYLSAVWLEQAQRRREGSYVDRPVCPPDSWNGDFYGGVRPLETEPIVTKHRFNAFIGTNFDVVLRAHGIRTLVLTGVATNVCVESTARHAFLTDYYVVLASDGTAAYGDDLHRSALDMLDRYFGQVVSCDEIAEVWRSQGAARAAPSSLASVSGSREREVVQTSDSA